jgi:hypothetical protein
VLSDETIAKLQEQHGKIGVVDFEGHRLVFRRPNRVQVREYRRKEDSAAEKPDRVDQLAQQTIVALDDVNDPPRAAQAFQAFLDEYPGFCDSPKFQVVIAILTGIQETENTRFLGKGCDVWSATRKPSPTASAPSSAIPSPTTPQPS